MQTLLIYDIPEDRPRAKIADACLDYGLQRIQYSAFLGEISVNRLDELLQRIVRVLGGKEGKVEAFPICERDMRLRKDLDQLRLKKR